jgi:hypothetical protein
MDELQYMAGADGAPVTGTRHLYEAEEVQTEFPPHDALCGACASYGPWQAPADVAEEADICSNCQRVRDTRESEDEEAAV